jgi:hypothetical protein
VVQIVDGLVQGIALSGLVVRQATAALVIVDDAREVLGLREPGVKLVMGRAGPAVEEDQGRALAFLLAVKLAVPDIHFLLPDVHAVAQPRH